MIISTLFESEQFEEGDGIPYKEVYPLIKAYLSDLAKENRFEFNGTDEITFESTKISFGLFWLTGSRKYTLSFFPKNIWTYAFKSVLTPAFQKTVKFFEMLPNIMDMKEIKFIKSNISGEINVGDWTFSTEPDIGINKLKQIGNAFQIKTQIGNKIFEAKKGSINKKLLLIDGGGILNRIGLNKLQSKISPLFKATENLTEHEGLLEEIEMRSDKSDLFIVIFGKQELIDEKYTKYKEYFILNDIPSQFIGTKDLDKNTLNWGFENLLFELLKKGCKKDSILLDTINSDVDGFLCLSDIGEIKNNKLFGISISFKGNYSTEDFLEIYNDIDYNASFERIKFEEGDIGKLTQKISAFNNLANKKIDVFVSKRWGNKDVNYLCKLLAKNNITIRKFFYIGCKANRFLFSSLTEEETNLFSHPYIIWNEVCASIQTNSKIQLYGTMFPIYLELLNSYSKEKLTKQDLETLVWLTKKRIYRINNFFNLKSPEILAMIDEARKLNLQNIPGKLRISLHSLI